MPRPNMPTIHTFSLECTGGNGVGAVPLDLGTNLAAIAWPTANMSLFLPFYIEDYFQFVTMFMYAGANVTNQWDIGVFDETGKKLISTGAFTASASVLNVKTVAKTILGPGRYYLGISCAGTASTIFGYNTAGAEVNREMGMVQMATNHALGDATFAQVASALVPLFGLSNQAAI